MKVFQMLLTRSTLCRRSGYIILYTCTFKLDIHFFNLLVSIKASFLWCWSWIKNDHKWNVVFDKIFHTFKMSMGKIIGICRICMQIELFTYTHSFNRKIVCTARKPKRNASLSRMDNSYSCIIHKFKVGQQSVFSTYNSFAIILWYWKCLPVFF